MEEDVHNDDAGVDGRGVCGWDGRVCGLGEMGDSTICGLVRRTGAFTGGLLTFALVSGLQLAQHKHGSCHIFSAALSSRLEAMVADVLMRASAFRFGLGVGRALIASGLRTRPSHLIVTHSYASEMAGSVCSSELGPFHNH